MKSGMKIMFDFSFQWKFQRESHAIEISNREESQMVVSLFLFGSSQVEMKMNSKITCS